MEDRKKTYFIDVGNGEISQSSSASTWSFRIEANDEEITRLREEFDHNYTASIGNFLRAHVPYVEYHNDRENHIQDQSLTRIYQMIHDLGDEEARRHIESMGILPEK